MSVYSVVSDGKAQISLSPPLEQDIIINSDPSFAFTDYLIYLTSAVAFQYELDVLSSSRWITAFIFSIFSHLLSSRANSWRSFLCQKHRHSHTIKRHLSRVTHRVQFVSKVFKTKRIKSTIDEGWIGYGTKINDLHGLGFNLDRVDSLPPLVNTIEKQWYPPLISLLILLLTPLPMLSVIFF